MILYTRIVLLLYCCIVVLCISHLFVFIVYFAFICIYLSINISMAADNVRHIEDVENLVAVYL